MKQRASSHLAVGPQGRAKDCGGAGHRQSDQHTRPGQARAHYRAPPPSLPQRDIFLAKLSFVGCGGAAKLVCAFFGGNPSDCKQPLRGQASC